MNWWIPRFHVVIIHYKTRQHTESIPLLTRLTSTKSNSGFKYGFPDWSRSGWSPYRSRNVGPEWIYAVVGFSHFVEFCEKRTLTVWGMLITVLKKPYSVVVRGVESDLEYVSGTKSPQKVLPISRPVQTGRDIEVSVSLERQRPPTCRSALECRHFRTHSSF